MNSSDALSKIEVYAFVGPAGTGKSHRATHVAKQNGIDYIIDDGLVISRGRILAGKSAKSELNRLRAIKRAIFEYPEHRDEVINYLAANPPQKVMILATSAGMVDKITDRLGLNSPVRTIYITDIASEAEIKAALRERREKKQHVVPVAKAQIQHNFAGKLVSQIRGFFRGRGKNENSSTIVKPLFSFNGKVTIGTDAMLEMCRRLINDSGHVKKIREIDLETDDDKIELSVEVDLTLGQDNALSIARRIQRHLNGSLSYFTGMDIRKVNIRVNEIYL